MRVLYLHGFASGPASGKARYFVRRFAERNVDLEIPELVDGKFEDITVSGQLRVIESTTRGEPVSIVGSSMGGYLAALYAARHSEVQKLVLIAPAFHFPQRWPEELGSAKTAEWQRTGTLEVFHYGEGRQRNVGWGLLEDARLHDPAPSFSQPALIFHGTRDTIVPPAYSEKFAETHPNVLLRMFDSDHQLSDVVEEMWLDIERFLFEK